MLNLSFPGPGPRVSLHNHSTWSDGQHEMETVVRIAKESGLKLFGLSDHYVPVPTTEHDASDWSMKLDRLPDYVAALETLKATYNDENFTLLTGLEVDYFEENFADVQKTLKQYPLDYIIGSSHFVGTFPVDNRKEDWDPLTQEQIDTVWDGYWKKELAIARSGFFTFMAHLDLPKKYAHYPSTDQMPRIREILDAAQASGTAIELNTSGLFKPCAEQYPSAPILREIIARRIPIPVNADAHLAHHINRKFTEAYDLLAICAAPQI